MLSPRASQTARRSQFSEGSENISRRQKPMPRIGTKGTNGARKGRAAFGFVRRMMSTAAQTITKASRVPMFTRSARTRSGTRAATVATKRPVTMVDLCGVRKRSCTAPKNPTGSKPSRAMARSTRAWLSIMTRSTEVMPVMAPSEIRKRAHGSPAWRKASATGALMSILS